MSGEREFPIRWDLTGEDAIIQGATWRRYRALEYLDPADGLIKLWDTTGFTARMAIRASYDGPVLLSATTENGRLQTGIRGTAPNQYNLGIVLSSTATAALGDWGLGVYDLEVVDAIGNVTRVYHGAATLEREVTR